MTELNRNEMEAMRILWRGEPLKPAQIQAQFAWGIVNATLRSVLMLLVDKGLAAREKRGKAFFYRAKISQRVMFSKTARAMAHVFAGGSAARLIAQLIKSEKLSRPELDELLRIASDKISQTSAKARKTD